MSRIGANPQPDIFLKYSKELLCAKMKARISGVQNQVWEAVMMLTYGGRPPVSFAEIKNSKISKFTGLSAVSVSKAKADLVSMNMLITKIGNTESITKNGNAGTQLLGINKHYDQWEPLPKKVTLPNLVKPITKNGKKNNPAPIIKRKKEKINKKSPSKRTGDFHSFFWPIYPRKVGKGGALKKWETLAKKGELPPTEKILSAIKNQIKEKEYLCSAKKFCPEWKHPSTWLNQACWDDEAIIPAKPECKTPDWF